MENPSNSQPHVQNTITPAPHPHHKRSWKKSIFISFIALVIGVNIIFALVGSREGLDENQDNLSLSPPTPTSPSSFWNIFEDAPEPQQPSLQDIQNIESYNTNQVSFVNKTRLRPNPPKYVYTHFDSTPPSINNIHPESHESNFVVLNNLLVLQVSLEALSNTGWGKSGNYSEPISITYRDLSLTTAQLDEILAVEVLRQQGKNIPSELSQMYTDTNEIESVMSDAYVDFMSYLEAKDVDPRLIQETKTVVPHSEDRFHFTINWNAPSSTYAQTNADGSVNDYSRRVVEITSGSLFNNTKILFNSRIFGPKPSNSTELLAYYKNIRDMAIRLSVYHEMTHVLQRAYMILHAPQEDRSGQHIHLDASKTLADLDSQNKWRWNRYTNNIDFEEITRTQESQADGIAFEILTNAYDMSNSQRDALWTHFFGRLDPSWEIISEIKTILHTNWPDMTNKAEIGLALDNALFDTYPDPQKATKLRSLLRSSSSLPADAGYNAPIRPEETNEFWDALKAL